jgi:hypothetical protein
MGNHLICIYSQNEVQTKPLILNLLSGDSESTSDLECSSLIMKNLAFHRVNKNIFIVLNKGMVQAYKKLNTLDSSFEVFKLGISPYDLRLGQSISGVARISRGNDRRVHFATHLFKHGLMKICSTKMDSEFPRVKLIT